MTTRNTLPQRRFCETFEIRHGKMNTSFVVTVGRYNNGDSGEIFISGAKAGSEVEAVARDGAVLLSLCLQYGAPLDVIHGALTKEANGSPSTVIGAVVKKLIELPPT
jgi:hypothetical protein